MRKLICIDIKRNIQEQWKAFALGDNDKFSQLKSEEKDARKFACFDSPSPPAAPDYASANREGIVTDVTTLPARRKIEQMAKLGQAGVVNIPYQGDIGVDFTGVSDADVTRAQNAIMGESADALAKTMLDIQRKYGKEFNEEQIKRIQESDPTGYALRQSLASQLQADTGKEITIPTTEGTQALRSGLEQSVLGQLQKGEGLTDEEIRQSEQSIRAGQTARGNVFGTAPTAQEVLGKYQLGRQRLQERQTAALQLLSSGQTTEAAAQSDWEAKQRLTQQRLANTSAYVLGTPITAQYQNIRGAQAGAAPFTPAVAQGTNINPNAGQNAANFALQSYGTQASIYNTQLNNSVNPWMVGLGFAQAAASAAPSMV